MRNWSFTQHPQSVNETYLEHLAASWSFARSMAVGCLAAVLHGIFPFLCVTTGSSIVKKLNDRMVVNRIKNASREQAAPPLPR